MALLRKEMSRFRARLLAGGEAPWQAREMSAPRAQLPLPLHGLARRKVDLDPRSAWVEEKQLPKPSRMTVLGQAPQVVFDSARLELGHIGRGVGSEKGDMVEHPAAF